jgi:hypothetical protein
MPTIKLKGGSVRIGERRYTAQSDPFEVSDKIAKTLNCSIVVVDKPKPVKKYGTTPSK